MTKATDVVEEVEGTRDTLRTEARRALGVTGDSDDAPPRLRATLARYHLGLYPLVAIGLLGIVDEFQGYAFSVLAPDISRALGVGKGIIAGVLAVKTFATAVAPLPMAALAQH